MGDAIEGIVPDDPRFDYQTKEISWPMQEKDHFRDLIRPIKNKHLTCLIGNHEWKQLSCGFNTTLELCKDLDIEYGTMSSKISVYDDHGLMYRIYVHHGFGAVNSRVRDSLRRRTTNLENLKSKLFLLMGDCELMAMGHTHKLLVFNPKEQNDLFLVGESRLRQHYELPEVPISGFIHPDFRWYCNTGSYLKLYGGNKVAPQSGYAERMGLIPSVLGFINIKVRDRKIVDAEVKTI
jgi:hypothetical protein